MYKYLVKYKAFSLKTIRGGRVWWTKHYATFHKNRKIEENKNLDNMHIFGIVVCNILQEKRV
jgi:hypothetical protein